jgi:hypothetical protein
MAYGLTVATPYYSTSLIAILAANAHYYQHLKQYVANIRGVCISSHDSVEDDLDRIRTVNAYRDEDGDAVQVHPDREPEQQVNRPLVPFIVFSPNLLDTILKNVVPESKFDAYYTDLDGVRRLVKTRAVEMSMKVKTYVTNWTQALVIAEYMLAATPNTMTFDYSLFNLPNASPEAKATKGTMTIGGPMVSRVLKRDTDGSLFVISQEVVVRFTIAVLEPGNQNDNGTSDEDADGAILKIVERFNLDVWHGMLRHEDDANWLTGAVLYRDHDDVDDPDKVIHVHTPLATDVVLP